MTGYALFASPVGVCGIAWNAVGVAGIQLPDVHKTETRARMRERFPEAREVAPPPQAQRAVDAIVGMLDGDGNDLHDVLLDMAGIAPFSHRVYETARAIPPGSTISYGELAAQMGSPRSARAVGQALGRNPFPIVVPCHRVFASGGKVGGFSATGGTRTKLRLLSLEGNDS